MNSFAFILPVILTRKIKKIGNQGLIVIGKEKQGFTRKI